jgi:hypothetical protein
MSILKKLKRKGIWILIISVGLLVFAAQFWPENWYARAQVRDILIKSSPPEELLAELGPYIKVGDSYDAIYDRLAPRPSSCKPLTENTQWCLQVGKEVGLVVAMRASGEVVGIGRYRAGIQKNRIEWLANVAW